MQKGFTIMEVVVIIAIMAVMVAIVFVGFNEAKRCEQYKDLKIFEIPASCVEYFSPHTTTIVPMYIHN